MSNNVDNQIERLKICEFLKEHEVKELCDKVKEILLKEPNVVHVESPVTVILF